MTLCRQSKKARVTTVSRAAYLRVTGSGATELDMLSSEDLTT